MPDTKKPSRIQMRNRRVILDAALDVFSRHGYRGATLDQIATEAGLSKPNILFDEKCAVITGWVAAGKLAPVDPRHLLFSIWATTQHYADFEVQVDTLLGGGAEVFDGAAAHLETLFRKLLTP